MESSAVLVLYSLKVLGVSAAFFAVSTYSLVAFVAFRGLGMMNSLRGFSTSNHKVTDKMSSVITIG